MEVLYDWWQSHDEDLRISFKNKSIYIGYPTNTNLEPQIFADISNQQDKIKNILEFLLFIENMVTMITNHRHLHFRSMAASEPNYDNGNKRKS